MSREPWNPTSGTAWRREPANADGRAGDWGVDQVLALDADCRMEAGMMDTAEAERYAALANEHMAWCQANAAFCDISPEMSAMQKARTHLKREAINSGAGGSPHGLAMGVLLRAANAAADAGRNGSAQELRNALSVLWRDGGEARDRAYSR